jgi:hypothetical protein
MCVCVFKGEKKREGEEEGMEVQCKKRLELPQLGPQTHLSSQSHVKLSYSSTESDVRQTTN